MQRPKILLVDDSPNILKALMRLFKGDGYQIFTASSGSEALNVLAKEKIDLIISDYNMPEMSGIELLKTVKIKYPDIIRIMLTGITEFDVARDAINKGEIYRFFSKPYDDFEMKLSIKYAFKIRELEKENVELKRKVMIKEEMLSKLEENYPGITEKNKNSDGSFIIDVD